MIGRAGSALALGAPLLLGACAGGTLPVGAAAPYLVHAPLDRDCSVLIDEARRSYGPPDPAPRAPERTVAEPWPIVEVYRWSALGLVMSFTSGAHVAGCEARYEEGGPADGVPAIVAPVYVRAPIAARPPVNVTSPAARSCAPFGTIVQARSCAGEL